MIYFIKVILLTLVSMASYGQARYTVTVPEGTQNCFIAGEMTGWAQLRMNKKYDNVFTIYISYATTSDHYRYSSGPARIFEETTSDGSIVADRNYSSSDQVAIWALVWNGKNDIPPSIASGSVFRHYFNSAIVDDRYIDIWLPAGYDFTTKYDVLYMQDGEKLFDSSGTLNGQEWNADSTMGALDAAATIDHTIVVGIHSNGNKRHAEYFPQKVFASIPEPQKSQLSWYFYGSTGSDNYLKFVVNELKPFIDANFSTSTGHQNTFIAGASLGGLLSVYAYCEYPGIFSRAACLSTHWIGTYENNTEIPGALNNYLKLHLPEPSGRKLYFDHGSLGLDSMYSPYQQNVNNTITARGYNLTGFKSGVFPGADHNENAWRARFDIPANFLLSNTSIILAVGIFDFHVEAQTGKSLLSWKTTGSTVTGNFTIEKSRDGTHFNGIGSLPSGNKTVYTYTDNNPGSGKIFYRIRLQDSNGNVHFSKLVFVNYKQVSVHPNPAQNFLYLEGLDVKETKIMVIYDTRGSRQDVKFDNRNQQLNISALASGMYILYIGDHIIKFIKQ